MATKTKDKLTLEQFLKRPETKPAREFVCGEVFRKPMPDLPHSLLQRFFILVLAPFSSPRGTGVSVAELRCIFGPPGEERGYVPDVVFISRARLPHGDARAVVPFRAAPDLAIEVLSPRQRRDRFRKKLSFYLEHGVRLVWVVDPRAETVTVHRPGAAPVVVRAGDTLDGADLLPGFTLPVADIFAELRLE